MKPEFDSTATGYRWLDRLTRPYWRWSSWRAERKLYRLLGQGDVEEGRRVFETALSPSDD